MLSRIAVLISGGGSNLQALLDAEQEGRIPYGKIVVVISNQEKAYGLVRAQQKNVPTYVVTKREYAEKWEEKIKEILEEYEVDIVVLAGFLSILSAELVAKYPQRMLNIHPSLLPAFGGKGMYGLKVHEAVLQRGVKITGASVHYVNEVADGGEILCQKAVLVEEGDTPEILQQRVMKEAEWQILPQVLAYVSEKWAKEKENGSY